MIVSFFSAKQDVKREKINRIEPNKNPEITLTGNNSYLGFSIFFAFFLPSLMY